VLTDTHKSNQDETIITKNTDLVSDSLSAEDLF